MVNKPINTLVDLPRQAWSEQILDATDNTLEPSEDIAPLKRNPGARH